MIILLKAVLGAAVAVCIHLIARSRHAYAAALIPLFPTFMLFVHVPLANADNTAGLRRSAIFGMLSLVPYATYLFIVWWASSQLHLPFALLTAAGCWMVVAAALVLSWNT